ncbi:tRNA pseudouridine(38-40) synthase TruA [Anaerobacillus alkalidiazotrophicus]|uniref:tRNA pseudouridine synthase A n=1 Tax=Anaerobacillus alkalidiazotrophicus TaxID=472963 RepID=A0A1S2M855_9BACI|nr:tRNA pseudouridine(38-40) synthase TruA [Anaerobacillus alkalidiazotrophicus]OIJ20814.1 tRNA pseudouridine(38-40) synthase TruA [Anaerobacillus alkalidiazotrophicus]
MNNYKMTIQYDGGRYKGWQRLGSGENTIQAKIENVISQMVDKQVEIIGCSRTDAGVHALDQIANFKTNENLSEAEIKSYLNKYLPQDITITDVELVHDRFHSRYNAKDKTYLFKIWNEEHSHPFMRKYSMHVDTKLDIVKMKNASTYFIGSHDFTAFSNAKSKKKSMVREIYDVEINENSGFIEIRVRGNGFLYNMVRKMVGTLIEVGLGEIHEAAIPEILTSKERKQTGRLADSCGLYLEKVEF